MAKTETPPPVLTIPPPPPKKPPYSGPTAADILRTAKRTGDWVTARAELLKIPNYSPAKADTEIKNAQVAATKPPKPPKGASATDIITAARNTNTPAGWATARKQLIHAGYAPDAADIKIQNAQKAVVTTSVIHQSTITKTLSPASTPQEQAAAIARLSKLPGIDQQDAATIVHAAVTPSPNVVSLPTVLEGLQSGAISRDDAANIYFPQLGISHHLAETYLKVAKATYDKWAVLGKDGRIKFVPQVSETQAPKNALMYGGAPLTQQTFLSNWNTYKDTFFAYTGRQASGKEIAQILKTGPTIYGLANKLADQPTFTKSPIYKQHAPGVVGYAKSVLGQNWKVDQKLVTQAITQSWDQATIDAHLRQQKAYLQGPEFKDGAAKKAAVYQQIYGVPDVNALHTIGQAQLQGWTDDEFAQYLRGQPQYTKSQEFLSKILSFGSALGMITGQQPGLVTGGSQNAQPMPNPNTTTLKIANNPRLPAAGPVQSPLNFVPTGVA